LTGLKIDIKLIEKWICSRKPGRVSMAYIKPETLQADLILKRLWNMG